MIYVQAERLKIIANLTVNGFINSLFTIKDLGGFMSLIGFIIILFIICRIIYFFPKGRKFLKIFLIKDLIKDTWIKIEKVFILLEKLLKKLGKLLKPFYLFIGKISMWVGLPLLIYKNHGAETTALLLIFLVLIEIWKKLDAILIYLKNRFFILDL